MVLEESNSCDSSSPVEGSLKGAAVVHVAVQEGNSIIPNSRECRAEGVSCMKVGCQIVTILVLPVDFCSFFKHLIMVSCYTVLTDSGSGDKYQKFRSWRKLQAQTGSLACSWAPQQGSLANPCTCKDDYLHPFSVSVLMPCCSHKTELSAVMINTTLYRISLFNTLIAKARLVSAKDKLLIWEYSFPAWCIYLLSIWLSVPTCLEHKACQSLWELVQYALVCLLLHIK